MHFYYDAQSRPAMVNFNGAYYMYLHNLQGDIVGLVDSGNNIVVEYKYDAWGKPTLKRTMTTAYDTLATLNPFRYRGYIYDEASGLYYLRSRFYNPVRGRFVNADEYVGNIDSALRHNTYCYCRNAPVIKCDPSGCFDWKALYLGSYLMRKAVAARIASDKCGYIIVEHWFNGGGKKLVIENDPEWNQYLLDNKNFANRIKKHASTAVHNETYTFDVKNE